MFNFKEVEAAESQSFIEPGNWVLQITGAKFEQPENGKTPYIKVEFKSSTGATMSEKFFITPKAFGRLQYLHTNWVNAKLEKEFQDEKSIGAYFEKLCSSPQMQNIKRRVLVQGQIAPNGKVYTNLPYTGFVTPDGVQEWTEGKFVMDSPEWKMNVTIQQNAATRSNNVMLSDDMPSSSSSTGSIVDDLPF